MATEQYALSQARIRAEREQKAQDAFKALSDIINGGSTEGVDIIANLVANDHPTLSGQFAKAAALGVMRRAVRDEAFRPFDSWEFDCREKPFSADNPPHPEHDGRHTCQTVIGAMLLAGQPLI